MPRKASHLLVFDIDGVLLNSREQVRVAWADTCEFFGLDSPLDIVREIGKPLELILSNAFQTSDVSFEHFSQVFRKKQLEHDFLECAYPGIPSLLAQLQQMAWLEVALFSSRPEGRIRGAMQKLELANEEIRYSSADGADMAKPNPLGLNLLRNHFYETRNCLYVGDTALDSEAAQAAGFKFYHAAWGYGVSRRGDAVLHSPEELVELLKSWGKDN